MHDEHNTERSENAAPPDDTPPQDGAAQPSDNGPPPDDGAPPDDEPSADADAPRSKSNDIDRLQRERDEYYERLIRTTADFDNYRKRTDRERRELSEYAATTLLTDLLPLVDDLERALAADDQNAAVDRRGVEIIRKQLLDLMAKRGVTPIEAVGSDFDPNLHQAVAHEPSETHRDGEIIEELRRGYTLRDRLLRASMVKVAKA